MLAAVGSIANSCDHFRFANDNEQERARRRTGTSWRRAARHDASRRENREDRVRDER
ncbi:peptidoglycan-binding protein [Sesbania bispinosa]|nr:peptidoglycan-binding protein [Sesbania bispinosa]